MISQPPSDTIGLLLSGGLDSGILLGHLLRQGRRVRPFYVRSGLCWEAAELDAVSRYLRAIECERLDKLVVLEMPLGDLYTGHWSLTGEGVPAAETPDEAVYLPGRNALLVIKALLWCHLRGISQLALAPLQSNPFPDATDGFFQSFSQAMNMAANGQVEMVRPFAHLDKRAVMMLGRELPLELTFSCIAPCKRLHCGNCNKCGERQAAFREAGIDDPTRYASTMSIEIPITG